MRCSRGCPGSGGSRRSWSSGIAYRAPAPYASRAAFVDVNHLEPPMNHRSNHAPARRSSRAPFPLRAPRQIDSRPARGLSRAVPGHLPLAAQRLVVVTGKGGVGKTSITAALARAAAEAGRRVLAVEVGQARLGPLLDAADPLASDPVRLTPTLSAAAIDPEVALGDFLLGVLRLRFVPGRLLESTSSQGLAAAAPGLAEFLVLYKIGGWLDARRLGRPLYDLVIVDAPASGHSLPLLSAPRTLGALARVGPVAETLAA